MKKLFFTFVGLSAFGAAAHSQAVYDSTSGAPLTTVNTQHFMELVTIDQGPFTPTTSLTGLNVSLNFTGAVSAANPDYVVVTFHNSPGVDTSPTSSDALASYDNAPTTAADPNFLGQQIFAISGSGSNVYSLSLTPIALPNNTFSVDFLLLNPAGNNYATDVQGNFTVGVGPSVGSNALANKGIWSDAGQDGIYQGSEQSTLGGTQAAVRFSLTAVPEPSALAFSAIAGVVLLGSFIRMRRLQAA